MTDQSDWLRRDGPVACGTTRDGASAATVPSALGDVALLLPSVQALIALAGVLAASPRRTV